MSDHSVSEVRVEIVIMSNGRRVVVVVTFPPDERGISRSATFNLAALDAFLKSLTEARELLDR